MGRRLIASALVFLLAGFPLPAPVDAIGVITQCSGANLGTALASNGAGIYTGDRFFTDATGFLRLRSRSAKFLLAPQSSMILRGKPTATEAELTGDTLTFSSSLASAIEVHANRAIIRPAADAPTVALIQILGPKEIRVSAQLGALQFTYNDESGAIPEGASYKVVLDPPDAGQNPPFPGNPPRKAGRHRRGFFFLLFGVVGGVTAWGCPRSTGKPRPPMILRFCSAACSTHSASWSEIRASALRGALPAPQALLPPRRYGAPLLPIPPLRESLAPLLPAPAPPPH
jgi:hypothetical protein